MHGPTRRRLPRRTIVAPVDSQRPQALGHSVPQGSQVCPAARQVARLAGRFHCRLHAPGRRGETVSPGGHAGRGWPPASASR